ncbi:polymorphic toxin-type HINT domain-containing protein, partial [Streptomyces sp. NPDC006482]|uniref:polymorphic toxin-type HINT domain-containing protein n=1 Tax=Streptomyces sp. NPDC006482 TaxID=3154306 RepID=UPI00339FB6BF
GGVTGTDTYGYDDTGNLQKKTPANAGPVQDLTWTEEGKLKTSTISGKTTSFLYDAEGTRIIKRDPTTTTLYLPGGQELALTRKVGTTAAAIANGTRYYNFPGGSAIRTSDDGKVRLLVADHHNTNTLSFSSTTLTFNRRKSLPYGGQRGAAPAFWPGYKGFVGGDIDTTTGFTHIGAREYDTGLGQFISVDPLLSLDQPQSLNGYSYANNNPTTASDPTGLESCYPHNCSGSNGTYDDYTEENDPAATPDPPAKKKETTGGGSGGDTGDKQPVIEGIRLPTEDELRAMSFAWPGDSYDKLTTKWAKSKCGAGTSGFQGSTKGFCETADAAGLLEVGDDPWGVKANVDCITGKGRCGEALLADVITLVTWGIGRFVSGIAAKSVKGAVAGGAAPEAGAVVRLLGGCKCFLAGTEVLMADGSTKAIEDVEVGDYVRATSPETGESGARRVTRLIRTESDKNFNTLTIDTGEGSEQLTATHEHPFWSPSERDWIAAGDLQSGMTLLTETGDAVVVTENLAFSKRARTYNLTVDNLHTYFVLAGETPVLVHNAGCDEFADTLQQKIGGEVWTLTPKAPFPALGDYKLAKESWGHHTVVVKDGRVYDQFTGKDGMPMDEWKAQWDYPDDHDWTQKR